MSYEVELCLDTLSACIAAQEVGADRVELCTRLDLDGLTPSMELVRKVRDQIDISLHVLVRPRSGDFNYSRTELESICEDIIELERLGIDGIVAGGLNEDGSLDQVALEQMMSVRGSCSFTFHRAFDVCREPTLVFEQLNLAQVDRVLTSGQGTTAIAGITLIQQMCAVNKHTRIMVGGGVNHTNIPQLWEAGARSFHFSCQKTEGVSPHPFNQEKARLSIQTLTRLSKGLS